MFLFGDNAAHSVTPGIALLIMYLRCCIYVNNIVEKGRTLQEPGDLGTTSVDPSIAKISYHVNSID